MKLLIVRFSSIGDIVLTTPVIRCLKQQLPHVEIHYLTKKAYSAILQANPYVHKVHAVDANNWSAVLDNLKKEEIDAVIDLHHNLRSQKVKNALKKPVYSFNKLNIEKWMLTSFKINILPSLHIVDRYLETVSHLGVYNDENGLDYFIPESAVVNYHELPMTHHSGFYALVIGAAHNTKKLPFEKLKALCAGIIHPIIILGGKEDVKLGELLSKTDEFKIYNACGKFSLHESADLIRKSKLVITHDTGLMHIAAAFKKPIYSFWGNTVPEFGMYPYYGNKKVTNKIFEVKHLACRPCSKIGYDNCPLSHFACMEKQNVDKLILLLNEANNSGAFP